MATLPNNPLFNLSDTNYLGVGFGASDSMGRDIDKLTNSNAEMFQMYGQQAIAMANQRSSNFQKFGNLFKEAATAKAAIDKWNDARDLDNEYNPNKDKEKEEKPEGGTPEGGPSGGEAEEPKEEKTKKVKVEEKKQSIDIKKDEAQLTYSALSTASKSNTVEATTDAINTVNVTKALSLIHI